MALLVIVFVTSNNSANNNTRGCVKPSQNNYLRRAIFEKILTIVYLRNIFYKNFLLRARVSGNNLHP